jgi:hypothetical protein
MISGQEDMEIKNDAFSTSNSVDRHGKSKNPKIDFPYSQRVFKMSEMVAMFLCKMAESRFVNSRPQSPH